MNQKAIQQPKDTDHGVGRELRSNAATLARYTQENIEQEYAVGCQGKSYCFLGVWNPYSDEEDEEFFGPRR